MACVAAGLFPQGLLRRFLEGRLRAVWGPGVRIGRLHVVPARLRLEADDLSLSDATLALTAPHLRATLSPSALLGGPLVFESLEIDGPRLVLHPSKGPSTALTTLPLTVARMGIASASLVYDDTALGRRVELRDLEVHGGLGTGALTFSASGDARDGARVLRFGPLRGALRVSPLLAVDVDAFEAHLGPSWIRAHGPLGRVGAWSPSLEIEGSADLSAISHDFALAPSSGTVSVSAQVSGAAPALQLKARAATRSAEVAGWPLDRLNAALDYDGGGAARTTMTLAGEVLGGDLDGHVEMAGSVLEAHATLDALDLERITQAAGVAGRPGSVSLKASVRGDLKRALESEIQWSAASTLGSIPASVNGGARGSVDPRTGTLDLEWDSTVRGATLTTGAGRTGLKGVHASLGGSARGAWPPDVGGDADLHVEVGTAAGSEDLPFHATFLWRAGETSLTLTGQPFSGTLRAEAALRGVAVDRLVVDGAALDLHRLDPASKGRASFHLSGAGELPGLTATGKAAIDDLHLGSLSLGAANLGLEGEGRSTRWTLDVPALRVSGEGVLTTAPTPAVSGALTLDDTPLAPFGPLAGRTLDGAVAAVIHVEAPLDAAENARIEARVSRIAASSGPYSLQSVQPFRLRWEKKRVSLASVSIRGSGAALTADGSFGFGEAAPIDLRVGFDADLGAVPAPGGLTLGGRITGSGSISGTRGTPRAVGAVEARGLSAQTATTPKVVIPEGRIDLAGDVLRIPPLRLQSGEATATISGEVPLTALRGTPATVCEGVSLRAEWSHVEVADFLTGLAPREGAAFGAVLSGHADATGCPRAPATLGGSLHLDESQIRAGDLAVNLSPVDLSLAKGQVSTEGVTFWTDAGALQAVGTVDLARKAVDARVDGRLELRALSPLVGVASFSGTSDVSVSLVGPFSALRPAGQLWIRDASVRMRDIPDALTAVNGSIRVEAGSVTIEPFTATLGGGEVKASGTARLDKGSLADVNVAIAGDDLSLRYPAGLRSRMKAALTLTGKAGAMTLGGEVHVLRGLYDLDAAVQGGGAAPVAATTPSPALRSIALAVRVSLDGPVVVRNNLASLEMTGGLAFHGDMDSPAPLGRVDIRRGGHVYLQGRDFSVDSGGLLYEGTWNPTVTLRASKQIRDTSSAGTAAVTGGRDYNVQLVADGPLDTVQPTLHTTPPLSESQAFSLVATGSVSSSALSAGAAAAGGQAASMFVGKLSQSLGLDAVSVQPELLARETNPGTRFTFGKQLSSAVSLIYSIGLSGPEQRFLQLEVRPIRSLSLKVQRTDDGLFVYGAGQSLSFGGPDRGTQTGRAQRPRLSEVRLEGDRPLPEPELRNALESKAGKEVSAWAVQEDADRLRTHLVSKMFLEAEVTGRLDAGVATFRIRAGRHFAWRVTGMPKPPDLGGEVRKALFEEDALERGRGRLLRDLRRHGYLRAAISARGIDEKGSRVLLFDVAAGDKIDVEARFPGASALSEGDILKAAGGPGAVLTDPATAIAAIRRAYREHQRLTARAGPAEIQDKGVRVVVTIPIDEGPRAKVASVAFEGATLPEATLRATAGIAVGSPFAPTAPADAVDRLRRGYMTLGFPRPRVAGEVKQAGPDVAITFHVDEGPRVFVRNVRIEGLSRTRESLVRRRIDLRPGDPLDPQRLAAVERRLSELGTFSRVAVVPDEGDTGDITVTVAEDARLVTSYDVRYDDTDKTVVQLDAEARNLLGLGITPGGRYRVGADVREGRGSLFLPSPLGRGSFTASAFRLQEDLGAVDPLTGESIVNVQTTRGFQVQDNIPLANRWNLLAGYRFQQVSSVLFPEVVTDAGIDASLARDTRDNPIDAHRGRFWSLNFAWSPRILASDFAYVKAFGQASFVRAFGDEWLWAHSYRLGVARGYSGQQVDPQQRFFAGGANSLRGYATETVGPRLLGQPLGGEAVVIVNQELRYMRKKKYGVAFFYDVGNVYATLGDVAFDLRHTLGLGLRWLSPIGLLRADLGVPLNRPPDVDPETGKRIDKAYRLFLSLGQAF